MLLNSLVSQKSGFKVTSIWAGAGKKNWNGQILEDARDLAKGCKVPGRLVFCSAFLWNEYNHWDRTEKLETRKQITELTMGYDIFVLDKS